MGYIKKEIKLNEEDYLKLRELSKELHISEVEVLRIAINMLEKTLKRGIEDKNEFLKKVKDWGIWKKGEPEYDI